MNARNIRIAQTCAVDARQAVQEFHSAIVQPHIELVVFFCSSEYDLEALAEAMNWQFPGIQVVGCTTAGEIGPDGYCLHSLTGASFAAGSGSAVSGLLDQLDRFDSVRVHELAQALLQRLEKKAPQADPKNTFALLLIDGMSIREEPVVHAMQSALGRIPLVGGSAGDDRKFKQTWVYFDGHFHTGSAALILISTPLPFRVFMTHHFVSTPERLVVTAADTATRTVKEINGLPAAEEYARLIGVTVPELSSRRFAASPLVVVIEGTDYVRSIQKVNPDRSMKFFCAIEEGVVLRLAHGLDLEKNLQQTFDNIRTEIGPPQLVFGCDCILRNEEVVQSGQLGRVAEVLRRNNTVGFSSYGEQYHGIHVNQTFTGIAVGNAVEPGEQPQDGQAR